MKMKWMAGFVLLAILYGISAWGQGTQEPLTLEESIKIALERSLQLHSSMEGVVGAEFKQKEAITNFLPTWTGQYAYNRYDKPVVVGVTQATAPGVLGVGSRDIFNLDTTITQPIFTGGANLANYRVQKLGVDISKTSVETVKRDIVLQVRTGYFNILRALKLRDVAEQSVKQFQAQLDVAQAFFEVGIVAKNDVLQAEVSLANSRQTLVKAENDLAVAKASFNTVLRRDVSTPFSVVDILKYEAFPLTFEESLQEALRQRSEIKNAELTIKQAEENVKVAKSAFYPTISISGNYNRFSDAIGLNSDSTSDRLTFQTLATFTLWNWGNTMYKVGESKVQVTQARDAKGQTIDSVTLEVRQDYLNMLTAEKNIDTAQKAVEQAEENLRMNEERYKYQVSTATDVLIAVTLLDTTRTNYYTALADFNIAKAQLERAMGRRM